jgi:hypothetical protein
LNNFVFNRLPRFICFYCIKIVCQLQLRAFSRSKMINLLKRVYLNNVKETFAKKLYSTTSKSQKNHKITCHVAISLLMTIMIIEILICVCIFAKCMYVHILYNANYYAFISTICGNNIGAPKIQNKVCLLYIEKLYYFPYSLTIITLQ